MKLVIDMLDLRYLFRNTEMLSGKLEMSTRLHDRGLGLRCKKLTFTSP
jgi:hypothetical protein